MHQAQDPIEGVFMAMLAKQNEIQVFIDSSWDFPPGIYPSCLISEVLIFKPTKAQGFCI